MQVAVIGHIEWGRFVLVDTVPKPGEIVHTNDTWQEVAGGGSVAAMQLAELADSCLFFTAAGNDEFGKRSIEQMESKGVEVYASVLDEVTTKDIYVYIDNQKERTITVTGNLKPDGNDSNLPWGKLADVDAVYFVSGNQAALLAARKAKTLVSTVRILPRLAESGVQFDALVCSKKDTGELYRDGDLSPKPKLVVTTAGVEGGSCSNGEKYNAEIVPESDIVDTYGCGDSFAAGLTFALGQNKDLSEALKFAAHCGAEAARRRGSFGNG
jgi:ribokinase